jgi:hypothetical protein
MNWQSASARSLLLSDPQQTERRCSAGKNRGCSLRPMPRRSCESRTQRAVSGAASRVTDHQVSQDGATVVIRIGPSPCRRSGSAAGHATPSGRSALSFRPDRSRTCPAPSPRGLVRNLFSVAASFVIGVVEAATLPAGRPIGTRPETIISRLWFDHDQPGLGRELLRLLSPTGRAGRARIWRRRPCRSRRNPWVHPQD